VPKAPLLSQEGWLRHQEKAAKPPLKAQTGWFCNRNFQDDGEGTTPPRFARLPS